VISRAVLMLGLAACAGAAANTPGGGGPVPVSPTPAPPDATITTGVPRRDPAVDPRVAMLAGLMPLGSTGVPDFLAAHPTYDGRGVVIAILDSGVDPGTFGLITTSTGAPKLLDVRDFSGEGRVALEPVAAGGNGTVVVGGRRLRGAGRIARLATGTWYAGVLRERPLGKRPAADLNGNASSADVFPVVVVRASDGWVALLDTNLDGSFEDETPLHDYRQGRETLALGSRPLTLAANLSEVDGRPVLDLVFDTSAHGTHVAGVAAGHRLYNLVGFNGVAPGAQVIALKIANNARGGITVHGSMARALRYAARFAAERGLPLVANVSFGVGNEREGRARMDSIVDAFAREHPRIVLTISAGNDGPGIGTVGFPGSADLALSVGATYPGVFAQATEPGRPPAPDVAGWFSSRGGDWGKPDLLAPGVAYSVVPRWAQGDEIKGGTSFSAPHVAGLAACLMSALVQERRPIEAADVIQALRATAARLPGETRLDAGAGVPRLEAAYGWLRAGHQGSQYVVTAPGGRSAALRRAGYAGPADTLDRFRVRHAAGLRAAHFRLRSDAPWLVAPSEVVAGPAASEILLTHRPEALTAPGLYVGTVSAYNPSDTGAGPLFTLVSAVVVPHDLAGRPLAHEPPRLTAGRVQRYFLRAVRPGATLRVRVELPDSTRETAIVRLFEPGGQPARNSPGDVILGDSMGTATIVVRAEDFLPGVYELDVLTPTPQGATVRARAELAQLELTESTAGLEVSNPGPGSVAARVGQRLIGAERMLDVAGRGAPAESLAIAVPPWAARAEVDVTLSPDLWRRLTDFAVTVFDSTGEIVANTAQNFAFGRLVFVVPPELAGRALLLELFLAYALPAEGDPWQARVAVRFLAPAAAGASGPGASVNVVAGGRVRVPAADPAGFDLPAGYRPLLEATALGAEGSPAVHRGAGDAP
jgi:subtilisin family serine protease